MKIAASSFVIVTLLIATATPLFAHHAFSQEFDVTNKIQIEGTVARVDWEQPHVQLIVNARNGRAPTTESWLVELNPIKYLVENGWTKNTVKPGMEIRVDGFLSRNPSIQKLGSAWITVKATGQVLSTPPGVDKRASDDMSPPMALIASGNAALIFLLIGGGFLVVFAIRRQFRRHFPEF